MEYPSRFFLPISTAFFLTAIFLGTFAKPVVADNTGFLSLINEYRAQNGVGALAEDQNLTNAACWMATDLDINGFSHTDSQGRSMGQRLTDFGVTGLKAENIYYTTAGSSANYAFDAWKNSSGHNTNMLNGEYTRIGIGRANVNGKWYWVTDFANGAATSVTNQCGTVVNQPTNPPAAPAPTSPNNNNAPVETNANPVALSEPAPAATIAADSKRIEIASKSATLSTKIVKVGTDSTASTEPSVLVKGTVMGSVFLITLATIAFLFWKFFHKFQS